MPADARSRCEVVLAGILSRFASGYKGSLAVELVEGLDLDESGAPYPEQVASRLGRALTGIEEFRIDTLERERSFGHEYEEEE